MERKFITPDQATDIVRAAFGRERRLDGVRRLPGGSKKGVYRLTFDDNSTAVLYVWDTSENYWPDDGSAGDRADPFSDASGVDLFEAGQACLDALGVRTPRTFLVDGSRRHHPADIAVVEDVGGPTLEELLRRDPGAATRTMHRLDAALRVMHRHTAPRYGKLAFVDGGGTPLGRACEQVVLDRALGHLAEVTARVERMAAVRTRLEEVTRELASAVRPRERYGLIHGELGPDHVLVDDRGQPMVIDIEGLMFFDVEWEHAFLRLRFGDHYRWLRRDGLDDRRLRFYALALHLSLVAGPLRLLDGDYPDPGAMTEIVEFNIRRILGLMNSRS